MSTDKWEVLQPSPPYSFGKAFAINGNEYIKRNESNSFQKFNITQNTWSPHSIAGLPLTIFSRIIAYDKDSSTMILLSNDNPIMRNESLISKNIATGHQISLDSRHTRVPYSLNNALLIDGDVHIFEEDVSGMLHYVLEARLGYHRSSIGTHTLTGFDSIDFVSHSKSRNSIILIGRAGRSTKFGEYSLSTKEWQYWAYSYFPQFPVSDVAIVCSADGRHLITFGVTSLEGYHKFCGHHIPNQQKIDHRDRIYIFNLDDHTAIPKESALRCPVQGTGCFHALMMGDRKRDEVMTYGFVRRCFNNAEMNNLTFPPRYLIELMAKWFAMEWIHLFERTGKKRHWKICLDDIL